MRAPKFEAKRHRGFQLCSIVTKLWAGLNSSAQTPPERMSLQLIQSQIIASVIASIYFPQYRCHRLLPMTLRMEIGWNSKTSVVISSFDAMLGEITKKDHGYLSLIKLNWSLCHSFTVALWVRVKRRLRGQQFNFWGGGAGSGDFEKIISCKCIWVRKHFLRKTIAQKNSRTYSRLGKNFGKMLPSWVDTLNFIRKLLKDLSIWTWVREIHSPIICPPQIAFSLHL